jgi:hypothetical protein
MSGHLRCRYRWRGWEKGMADGARRCGIEEVWLKKAGRGSVLKGGGRAG